MNLTNQKTNWKFILIVLILTILVGGGILGYLRYLERETVSLTKFSEIKKPEKIVEEETADWKTYRNEEYGLEFRIAPLFEKVGYKIEEKTLPYYYFKNQECKVIYFKTKAINPPFPERVEKDRMEPLFRLFICPQSYCEDEEIKDICQAIKENKVGIEEKDIVLFTNFITENENFFVFDQGCPSCGDTASFMGWLSEEVQEMKNQMLSTFRFFE